MIMLQANELMIGDWVLTLDSTHEKKVFAQVDAIEEGKHSILVTRECSNWFVDIDWIEPISLTPEILEKNGFKRDPLWHHCDKDLDNYSISVQLGYANRIEYIKIAEKGKDNVVPSEKTRLYLTHIKHVHQLQQALRLCKIKKEEIVL